MRGAPSRRPISPGSQSDAAAHGCRLATARLQPAGAGSLAAMHGPAGLTPGWESHACSSRGGCTRIRPGSWGVAASSTLELQARPGRVAHAPPPKSWSPRPLVRRHPRRASRPSLEPGVRVATGSIDRVCNCRQGCIACPMLLPYSGLARRYRRCRAPAPSAPPVPHPHRATPASP